MKNMLKNIIPKLKMKKISEMGEKWGRKGQEDGKSHPLAG
jgi:hypothetical protein